MYSPSEIRFEYWFKTQDEFIEFQTLQESKDFGFYKDLNDNQPLYDKHGNIKYNDINDKFELLLDNVTFIDIGTEDLISEVSFEDEELYIKVNPNSKLLRVVRVRNEEYYIGSI